MDSQESIVSSTDSSCSNFMRELEQRLYDGCSVTFKVPHDVGTTVAHDVLRGLEARGCDTVEIDLSQVHTVRELALLLVNKVLASYIGISIVSGNSTDNFLRCLSRPEIQVKIQDIVEVPYLYHVKENPLELLDEGVRLLERLPEQSNKRLVVWFHEFQTITRIDNGDHLLKRLRAMFQHQTHVSFSFTGSEQELMTMLFADHNQAFYRFAVMLRPG